MDLVQGDTAMFRRKSSSHAASAVCDINITPLIDVMLVLLVTLIVSLPISTHAVKLDMPRPNPSQNTTPPPAIDLEIDSDGTLVWDGRVLNGFQDLEAHLQQAARLRPQPEVHLHPDKRVKYNWVAQVLAAVQRNRVERMGFVNTGDFND
jgi:biopolymer transport protein ExbD